MLVLVRMIHLVLYLPQKILSSSYAFLKTLSRILSMALVMETLLYCWLYFLIYTIFAYCNKNLTRADHMFNFFIQPEGTLFVPPPLSNWRGSFLKRCIYYINLLSNRNLAFIFCF